MKKRYNNNQADVDPGRLVYEFVLYDIVTVPDGYGGYEPQEVEVLRTKAAKVKVGSGNQMAIAAGITIFDQDTSFVIRYRRDFELKKDMTVSVGSLKYTIVGFEQLETPVKWWRILCKYNGEE